MATDQMDTVIRHLRRAVLRRDGAGWTDGQLLASFIDHKDEAAFEALVRRHGPMVIGVCRRVIRNHHDAEDAFQATFLVLVRKASSVEQRERVANWLHGVALRTAMKAKAISAKRREKQLPEMPEPEAAQQDHWNDLQPLLDQELNGLPENYRLPILLCDLEGKTIKEATGQLGWPQGTLAGRLARGRKLLAKRLANRGIVLSGGSLVTVVSQNAASAAVPTSLMSSTVKAAAIIAAGQATVAGVVPAKVAILMEGVLKVMLVSKLKTASAGLLLVVLLIGVAGAIYRTQAAEQPKGEQRNKTVKDVSTSQGFPAPAKVVPQREYVVMSRLMEAGPDRPKEVLRLPKATVDAGQLIPIHISDGPQNLLAKVIDEEKIKIGTFLDVRVTRLRENKVRLFCSLQRNEAEKSSVSEIRVLGNSVQALQDIELHKPVKVVFQKDAGGSAQRWVEITVDEITADEQTVPPATAADSGPRQKGPKANKPAPYNAAERTVRVGNIVVIGNTRTETSVILKMIPLVPGAVLDYQALRTAEKNLAAFNATITVEESGDSSGFKDVRVTVKEK
jgi:RNA polymerase sigma factor (sigma-70 family)